MNILFYVDKNHALFPNVFLQNRKKKSAARLFSLKWGFWGTNTYANAQKTLGKITKITRKITYSNRKFNIGDIYR